MAVTASLVKLTVNILLNNGSTSTGAVKTKNLKLGGSSQEINTATYSANLTNSRTKVANIATALIPILSKSIYQLVEVQTNQLTEE